MALLSTNQALVQYITLLANPNAEHFLLIYTNFALPKEMPLYVVCLTSRSTRTQPRSTTVMF